MILKIRDNDGNIIPIPAIKGEKGDTPVKGKDYFTVEDVEAIVAEVLKRIGAEA